MKTCLPRLLELAILHHYYVSATEFPRIGAPACREAIRWLLHHDLLVADPEDSEAAYKITSRGTAHLLALLSVPLPENEWRTPWEKV